MNGDSDKSLARILLRELEALADPAKVAGLKQYFNVPEIRFLGINVPELRDLARKWYSSQLENPSESEMLEVCSDLLSKPEHEAKLLAVFLLSEKADQLTTSIFPLLKRWLARLNLTWAVVDSLSSGVLSVILQNHPDARVKLVAWSIHGEKVWVRRAAAVAYVTHARQGKLLDESYEIARHLIDSKHPYLHKANGWLLREAGKQNQSRLKQFLLKNGREMNRVTVRYAIEHFPPDEYQELLEATRQQ